jgi:hypothetical protein
VGADPCLLKKNKINTTSVEVAVCSDLHTDYLSGLCYIRRRWIGGIW